MNNVTLTKAHRQSEIYKRSISTIGLTLIMSMSIGGIAHANPVDPKILHALNRLSFGATAGDIEKVKSIGIDKYIQSQLNPESIAENPNLTDRLSKIDTLNLSTSELFTQYHPNRDVNGQKPSLDILQVQRKNLRIVMDRARDARWQRGLYSDRQLQEVMVDFWFNHFNIDANKGLNKLWAGAYERDAIRPHTFGKFRNLLGATARHPGMLFYLDNWQNSVDNPTSKGRFKGINENYARELMELHTLGVKGGYQQQDVVALAKILTGWGFKQPNKNIPDGYTFAFNPRRHDFSEKIFLGRAIAGSGIQEVETALDILAKHPSTANNISYKLAQYFVADNPPKTLVNRLSKRYLDTDGDMRSVLDTLFKSTEFWDVKYYGKKFKTPYQYALSAVRATGVEVNITKPLDNFMQQLGMPLYSCTTPDGYKQTQAAWLNPDGMNRRLNFATNLASGRLSLAMPQLTSANPRRIPLIPVDYQKLIATIGTNFSPSTQQSIASSTPELRAALVLGSPEFMYR
jgi:uncharacterized protein (DUF1800 family)